MPGDANVSMIASLLADQTRAAILMILLDGRALPAGELARRVRVSPATASHHLSRLVEHHLLLVEQQGRHRYFRLAGPTVAQMLEELAILAPALPVRSLRESEASRAMRVARMCYNHFAGQFGVALSQALVEREILRVVDGGYVLTTDGEYWLREVGITCPVPGRSGQIFAPHHIDWSERLHHVAGALGSALTQRFFERGWVKRLPTGSRAVRITDEGQQFLRHELGLSLTDDREILSPANRR